MKPETIERILKAGLKPVDFERGNKATTTELEEATIELAEMLSDIEAAVVELAGMIGGEENG